VTAVDPVAPRVVVRDAPTVRVVRGKDAVLALRPEWDDRAARAGDASPFLSSAWTSPWLERARGEPVAVAASAGGRLVALLVLVVRRVGPARVAVAPGAEHPSYHGLLRDASRPDAASVVADACVAHDLFDALRLDDVWSQDDSTTSLLRALAARGFFVARRPRNPCLAVALCADPDAFVRARLSKKSRQNLRHEARRLAELGATSIVRLDGPQISRDAVRRAAAVQRDSWMERRGAAVLHEDFHESLALSAARGSLAHLWFLTIDGDDAAFAFAVRGGARLHLVWTAFRLRYRERSPGKALVHRVVRDACSLGMTAFDFGHGDAAYKRAWATEVHAVERVIAWRGARAAPYAASCACVWRASRVEWLRSIRRFMRGVRAASPARRG